MVFLCSGCFDCTANSQVHPSENEDGYIGENIWNLRSKSRRIHTSSSTGKGFFSRLLSGRFLFSGSLSNHIILKYSRKQNEQSISSRSSKPESYREKALAENDLGAIFAAETLLIQFSVDIKVESCVPHVPLMSGSRGEEFIKYKLPNFPINTEELVSTPIPYDMSLLTHFLKCIIFNCFDKMCSTSEFFARFIEFSAGIVAVFDTYPKMDSNARAIPHEGILAISVSIVLYLRHLAVLMLFYCFRIFLQKAVSLCSSYNQSMLSVIFNYLCQKYHL